MGEGEEEGEERDARHVSGVEYGDAPLAEAPPPALFGVDVVAGEKRGEGEKEEVDAAVGCDEQEGEVRGESLDSNTGDVKHSWEVFEEGAGEAGREAGKGEVEQA